MARLTLGLFNSYDPRRFHEAMRRALARAAPVALAFDCNLATFGFPFDEGRRRENQDPDAPDLRTPVEVADFVAKSTSIGQGGRYFQQLAAAGRFHMFPFPDPGFPPQLGSVVATTPGPDPTKAITPRRLAGELEKRGHVALFGLGPHGLPREVLSRASHHLEITGKGLHLETATAIGALPAMLAAYGGRV